MKRLGVGADDGADTAGGVDEKVEEGEDSGNRTALEHLANLESTVKGAVKDQRVSAKNYMKDLHEKRHSNVIALVERGARRRKMALDQERSQVVVERKRTRENFLVTLKEQAAAKRAWAEARVQEREAARKREEDKLAKREAVSRVRKEQLDLYFKRFTAEATERYLGRASEREAASKAREAANRATADAR